MIILDIDQNCVLLLTVTHDISKCNNTIYMNNIWEGAMNP